MNIRNIRNIHVFKSIIKGVLFMNPYAEVLKQLLQYTETKYTTLSQAIDYDMSYISKWVNGARLPASRHADRIHEDMARFFANTAKKQHQEGDLKRIFSFADDGQDLAFHLYDLLSRAYRQAQTRKGKSESRDQAIHFYAGRADCHTALCQLLHQYLEGLQSQGMLVMTGQFHVLDQNGIWQLLEECHNDRWSCDVHLGLKMDVFADHMPQAASSLYQCLDHLLTYNFTMHEIDHESYRNIIVLKDAFAYLYYVDGDDYIDMCLTITDPAQVREIYKKCCAYMMVQPVLMEPRQSLGMEKFGYRDIFFTSNNYLFFLTNGLEFLLPDEVYTSLCQLIDEGKYPNATKEWVRRIQYIWYRIIEQGRMKIIMPKNSIIRYLETGCFYLTDMNYQMTPDERKAQLNLIVEKMKQNPAITYGILLPASGESSYTNFSNLAFYGNHTSAFFKKNTHHILPQTKPIYLLNNSQLIGCMHDFFDGLSHSPQYKGFSAENVDALRGLITPLMMVLTEENGDA